MHVPGAYKTHDLVTIMQHAAAHLEGLGVRGLEVKMRFRGYDADGNPVAFEQDGQAIDAVDLDINPDDFERPVLKSSTIKAVVANGQKKSARCRSGRKQQFKKPY